MSADPSITLVTLGSAFGLRNVSPFCLKIEMLLTSLGLPFEVEEQADPRKAPKGKLPYLKVDGKLLPDSELILVYIDELTQGKVYAGLTTEQKAKGTAFARLAEDHLYWIMVASRWLDDSWWPNIVEGFFHIAPKPFRGLAAGMARRAMRQTYNGHGLGRHTLAEQKDFARRDFAAIQGALTDTGFLIDASPNIYDFTVAGLLAGIYDQQPPTWITAVAQEYPELQAYAERVQNSVGVWGREVG